MAVSNRDEIGTAVYLGDNKGILLVGNLTGKQVGATSAQVFLERTPFGKESIRVDIPALKGWQWAFVPFAYQGIAKCGRELEE